MRRPTLPVSTPRPQRPAKGSGRVAIDHYHRWREDVAVMASLGVPSYRLSVSWPRVVPGGFAGSEVNGEGLGFYKALVAELHASGITPVVTIYHCERADPPPPPLRLLMLPQCFSLLQVQPARVCSHSCAAAPRLLPTHPSTCAPPPWLCCIHKTTLHLRARPLTPHAPRHQGTCRCRSSSRPAASSTPGPASRTPTCTLQTCCSASWGRMSRHGSRACGGTHV